MSQKAFTKISRFLVGRRRRGTTGVDRGHQDRRSKASAGQVLDIAVKGVAFLYTVLKIIDLVRRSSFLAHPAHFVLKVVDLIHGGGFHFTGF